MVRTILTRCTIFDGFSKDLLLNKTIVIEAGLITDIADSVKSLTTDRVIDIKNNFVMPGLIDAHFHSVSATLNIPNLNVMPQSLLSQHARILLEETLQRGFTTVRDAGGADFGLAAAVDQGLIDGPKIFFSGNALSQTGGHGDMRSIEHIDTCMCSHAGNITTVVDGVEEMRKAVREELRRGASQIKLFVSGGVLSPSDPIWMNQFHKDEITAAVEEAATRNTYVMAHAHTAEASIRCVELGVRSLEHGTLLNQQAADKIAEKNCFVVPTLSVIEGLMDSKIGLPGYVGEKLKPIAEKAYRSLEYCKAAGVKLGLGTDLFGELHGRELAEFRCRHQVNSPLEVLCSATSINAELLNEQDKLGAVKKGANADLLVISGNPLTDLKVMSDNRNFMMIMKNGKIYKEELE
jgi:imidazolonepropionase-like amidohydrolase